MKEDKDMVVQDWKYYAARTAEIMELSGRASTRKQYLDLVVAFMQKWIGCDRIGIRMVDDDGDVPFESHTGLDQGFMDSENFLSVAKDRCVCTRVITGRPEPQDVAAMTRGGSFRCDDLPLLISALPGNTDAGYRGWCLQSGVKSLAVIPIRCGKNTLGALYLSDAVAGKIPLSLVQVIESVTGLIGETIRRFDIEEELKRNYDTQTVLNSLTHLSLGNMPIEEILKRILEDIVSVPWLAVDSKCGIFITDDCDGALVLASERGFSKEVRESCKRVPFGKCICGIAAATRKIQFVACIDGRHEVTFDGVKPHGHYCVPISSDGRVLGVLNVYLKAAHRRKRYEEQFLISVANALAGIIVRKKSESWLAKINECFLCFGEDGMENINRITALCGEIFGATAAIYNRLDRGMLCAWGKWNAPPDLKSEDQPDGHICYDVIRNGSDDVFVVRNLSVTSYAASDPNVIKYGLQTYIGKVVKFAGSSVGSLCIVFQRDFVPTEEHLKLIGILAAAIGVEESRKQSDDMLKQEQRIFQGGPVTIFKWGARDGWPVEYVSDTVRQFGYEPDDLLSGRVPFASIVHPEDLARVASEVMDHSQSGAPSFEQEYRVITAEGRSRWLYDFTVIVRNDKAEITHYHGYVLDITDRKKMEIALRESAELYGKMVETSPDAVFLSDLHGKITYSSERAAELFHLDHADDILGKNCLNFVAPENREKIVEIMNDLSAGTIIKGLQCSMVRNDGIGFTGEISAAVLKDSSGSPMALLGVIRDITQRLELEEQLRQSQKMEAIGLLAGGLAHDFNNLLTTVTGYTRLILSRLNQDDPIRKEMREIEKAGERASSLTRQLLAYSRKQVFEPRLIDVNTVLDDMKPVLRGVLGESICLQVSPHPGQCIVEADLAQIEHVVLNLVMNSRDAMPDGGKVIIETAVLNLDDSYVSRHHSIEAGWYCMIAVSDTGHGMDETTQSHIFEPFFTTKERSKKSGLGLATVYGIVRQSGGQVWVYSESGIGTTFKVYLPLAKEGSVASADLGTMSAGSKGSETVLVVEDDESVKGLVCEILEMNGYTVLSASDGPEALRVSSQHEGQIAIMVTDVVMPGMSGKDLAVTLSPQRPDMEILFTSGYTDDAIAHHGVLFPDMAFLQKPFTPEGLAAKVREVIDAGKRQKLETSGMPQ